MMMRMPGESEEEFERRKRKMRVSGQAFRVPGNPLGLPQAPGGYGALTQEGPPGMMQRLRLPGS